MRSIKDLPDYENLMWFLKMQDMDDADDIELLLDNGASILIRFWYGSENVECQIQRVNEDRYQIRALR